MADTTFAVIQDVGVASRSFFLFRARVRVGIRVRIGKGAIKVASARTEMGREILRRRS